MSEDIIDAKLEKLKTRVRNIGRPIVWLGWFGIGILTPIYLYNAYTKNIFDSWGDYIPEIFLHIWLCIMLIILGSRIRNAVDKRIKTYLQWLILLIAVPLGIFIWLNGYVDSIGWMGIAILIYLLFSWVRLLVIMKNKDFVATLTHPVYPYFDLKGWIIWVLMSFIIMLVVAAFSLPEEDLDAICSESTEEEFGSMGEILRDLKNRPFPSTIDANTKLVEINENEYSIRYMYELNDIDKSTLTEQRLREKSLNMVCSDENLKYILREYSDIEHVYKVDTGDQYFVRIRMGDCGEEGEINLL